MTEQMTEQKEGIKYIVRIAGKDLNGSLAIPRALTRIKGIGLRMAKNISIVFEKETGIAFDAALGKISEEQEKKLEEIVLFPGKYNLPNWSFNRQKEYDSGQSLHLVGPELDFAIRQNLQRLNEIKSYRGLRHIWGLPVRGQRTRSTHRGKGGVIGVMKKDVKQAAASAGKQAGSEKKTEQKKEKQEKK